MLLNLLITLVRLFLKPKKRGWRKAKPEPTKAKTKCKKSTFELHEKFINEIKNDEKV